MACTVASDDDDEELVRVGRLDPVTFDLAAVVLFRAGGTDADVLNFCDAFRLLPESERARVVAPVLDRTPRGWRGTTGALDAFTDDGTLALDRLFSVAWTLASSVTTGFVFRFFSRAAPPRGARGPRLRVDSVLLRDISFTIWQRLRGTPGGNYKD